MSSLMHRASIDKRNRRLTKRRVAGLSLWTSGLPGPAWTLRGPRASLLLSTMFVACLVAAASLPRQYAPLLCSCACSWNKKPYLRTPSLCFIAFNRCLPQGSFPF